MEAPNDLPAGDGAENSVKDALEENDDNDNDKDTEKDGSSNKDTQAKSNKKRASKKDDRQHGVKRTRWDNRRIPNIAAELAKNRNIARGPSPGSTTESSSPTISQASNVPPTVRSDSESQTPEPIDYSSKKDSNAKRTQVKISSLLSSNGEESSSAPLPPIKSESEIPPLSQVDAPLQAPVASRASPKVILPTQIPGSAPSDSNDSSTDTPGVLIARMSSPVSVPPQAQLKKTMSNLVGENKTQAELAQKSNSMSSIPQSKDKQTNSSNNNSVEPKKNTSPKSSTNKESNKTGATKNDSSASTKKESSAGVKKDGTSGNVKKDNSSSKDNNSTAKKDTHSGNVKKENSALNTSKSNEKKDNKPTSKTSVKKENSVSSGTNTTNKKPIDTKKKPPVKKETAPAAKPAKTPKKLTAAPPIKSPSLLEVLERGKTQEEPEDPALIVDVPLYSTETNEYLDENGQVVFNFYKVVQDKFSVDNGGGNLTDLKAAKRNLFGQISGTHMDGAAEEDDDDIEEVEEDGEEEEEEEGEESKQNASPKKKSHPNKGKSLIGKYDTEDPFIDDTELLWEEQRAATKDGFFVYFGPLIEKGHYASLERADGTMKRGGVKNK
ncbi:hypothetical protein ZYGR_0I02080 [Zygosaccharomyces rouxii]|uniref:Hpc2-related domain-containing protein n=1 Tax=Zygosaccharomyces rouxii TaxID=4956 RepID=A0A1Q2ZWL5_ZYGRO|nr:hypothetical protein ZYGR_0I02080 [Zygosaccharomyces rouxii]